MKSTKRTLRTALDLIETGLAMPGERAALEQVAARYALAITPAITELMNECGEGGPIARQFLPDALELEPAEGEDPDPIGDNAHSPVEGIVHRYPDRVLLKLTSICAVYCRFCFRRETVGGEHSGVLSSAALARALAYLREHPEIWEVILTGGDPLVLSPRRLREVMTMLSAVPHIRIVRVHTRIPVAAPERITKALVRALKSESKVVWIVLHANHPAELTPAARSACARFVDAGFPMLSQSVLLRGVNDNAETLSELMRALVESRVKPYYLHHADLAPGSAHFRTGIGEGQALMRDLRGRRSGLCQPSYVLDIPGGHGKVPIGPNYLTSLDAKAEDFRVEDFRGTKHSYPPRHDSRKLTGR
jgi:lysine 2,3-aminomutase